MVVLIPLEIPLGGWEMTLVAPSFTGHMSYQQKDQWWVEENECISIRDPGIMNLPVNVTFPGDGRWISGV